MKIWPNTLRCFLVFTRITFVNVKLILYLWARQQLTIFTKKFHCRYSTEDHTYHAGGLYWNSESFWRTWQSQGNWSLPEVQKTTMSYFIFNNKHQKIGLNVSLHLKNLQFFSWIYETLWVWQKQLFVYLFFNLKRFAHIAHFDCELKLRCYPKALNRSSLLLIRKNFQWKHNLGNALSRINLADNHTRIFYVSSSYKSTQGPKFAVQVKNTF